MLIFSGYDSSTKHTALMVLQLINIYPLILETESVYTLLKQREHLHTAILDLLLNNILSYSRLENFLCSHKTVRAFAYRHTGFTA